MKETREQLLDTDYLRIKLAERVLFLEKVPMYLKWFSIGYSKDRHIPVNDLIKMIGELCYSCESMGKYLRGVINVI